MDYHTISLTCHVASSFYLSFFMVEFQILTLIDYDEEKKKQHIAFYIDAVFPVL